MLTRKINKELYGQWDCVNLESLGILGVTRQLLIRGLFVRTIALLCSTCVCGSGTTSYPLCIMLVQSTVLTAVTLPIYHGNSA